MRHACLLLLRFLPSCALRGLERGPEVSSRSRREFVAPPAAATAAAAAAEHRAEGSREHPRSLLVPGWLPRKTHSRWQKFDENHQAVEHQAGEVSMSSRHVWREEAHRYERCTCYCSYTSPPKHLFSWISARFSISSHRIIDKKKLLQRTPINESILM